MSYRIYLTCFTLCNLDQAELCTPNASSFFTSFFGGAVWRDRLNLSNRFAQPWDLICVLVLKNAASGLFISRCYITQLTPNNAISQSDASKSYFSVCECLQPNFIYVFDHKYKSKSVSNVTIVYNMEDNFSTQPVLTPIFYQTFFPSSLFHLAHIWCSLLFSHHRHHTNPVGTEWRWKMDPAEKIFQEALENHRNMIRQFRGTLPFCNYVTVYMAAMLFVSKR